MKRNKDGILYSAKIGELYACSLGYGKLTDIRIKTYDKNEEDIVLYKFDTDYKGVVWYDIYGEPTRGTKMISNISPEFYITHKITKSTHPEYFL